MVDDNFIHSLPLSSLPLRTRQLLSSRLNPQKIILSEGPEKLPRDWRGLASKANISSELEAYIKECADKTAKVLEIWQQNNSSATIGALLSHLEYIDRYDVHDDVLIDLRDAASSGVLSADRSNQIAIQNNNHWVNNVDNSNEITYDDRPGYMQMYDAIILYADQDRIFVDDMLRRMRQAGFMLCTINDVHVGHATLYAPVVELISNRCHCVVLVFSPEFFNSRAMEYYMNFAQADSIESRQRKIIPIMYRECIVPRNLSHYHKLFYQSTMYDFWEKLRLSLAAASRPAQHAVQNPYQLRINGTQQPSPPQIRIDEYPSDPLPEYDDSLFLPRSDDNMIINSINSLKINSMNTETRGSLSNVSQASTISEKKKKKKNPFSKLFGRKSKKDTAIMVVD